MYVEETKYVKLTFNKEFPTVSSNKEYLWVKLP